MGLSLATFNVKDLFDASDDASRAGLEAKLDALAEGVADADADVLGLQEVGSDTLAQAVSARAAARFPAFRPYLYAVIGTADARGIRNALLSRLPLLTSGVKTAEHLDFPAFVLGDPRPFGARIPLRRGVVHARVDAGSLGLVDVLVAHFKSNRPVPLRDAAGAAVAPVTARDYAEANVRSLVCRAAEALFVRGLVDDLLAQDPARHVLVAGDLNDHPSSLVVRAVCGGGPDALARCAEVVPEALRFSILRHGVPAQFDHVLASPGLRAHLQSARFLNERLRDHSTFADDLPPSADSDHAALVVSFA